MHYYTVYLCRELQKVNLTDLSIKHFVVLHEKLFSIRIKACTYCHSTFTHKLFKIHAYLNCDLLSYYMFLLSIE